MKYCNSCRLKVEMPTDHCPLCYAALTALDQEAEISPYPPLRQQVNRYHLALRICIFLSFTISLLSIVINLLAYQGLWWSAVVTVCVGYMWVVWFGVSRLLRDKRHISHVGFNITIQTVFVSLLLIVIDFLISRTGWPIKYVIPFALIGSILALSILTLIFKSQVQNFLLYLLLSCVFGFIPLALVLLFRMSVRWPSISCALYALITLLGAIVFADKDVKNQITKRFHS